MFSSLKEFIPIVMFSKVRKFPDFSNFVDSTQISALPGLSVKELLDGDWISVYSMDVGC